MGSFPDHQFPHDAVATHNTRHSSWRQVFRRALEQSRWKRNPNSQTESSDAVKTSSSSRASKIILGLAVALLLLVAIPIALIIRAESRRPHYYRQGKSVVARGESLLGMSQQGTAKPKPSPYKYTLATPITRPSNPIVFTPPRLPNSAASVPQQAPAQPQYVTPALPQTATNAPPPPLANTARAPFAPIVYSARHEKHFGGCSGQLTLNTSGLNFRCADDPGDNIQVALNEIGAIDENGVQTLSGKKYHFTITGMSKPAAQQLFSNWLHQVR
jgi:hypothetical protein